MTTPPRSPRLGVRYVAVSLFTLLSAAVCAGQVTRPASPPDSETPDHKEETVTLSPFTVDASKDIGYYAENTLAGSRLNTNVFDLGSSITVVTKQQMIDTSSVDINDVFMYEASTEGANTYTQTDVSRNGIPRDTIAGYSNDAGDPSTRATATRVRGLAAPDTAINNYPSIARVPFDVYNTTTLEISRGPNSLLFGTGSPAGIVNQSTASATLNSTKTTVEARYGSWDDTRVSFSHNQALIKDKLAIYVAGLWQDAGFRRKPSYDTTDREYVAVTIKPLKKTQITASFEHYNNKNNRPNFQTPRDYVTPWLQAGRPAYDPVSRTVTILDTGEVKGPYVTDTHSPGWTTGLPVGNPALTSATSSLYVPGIQFGIGGSARTAVFQDQGKILFVTPVTGTPFTVRTPAPPYSLDYVRPATTALTPAQWMIADRRLTSSLGPPAPAGYGNYVQPASTDSSIYDYEHVNLLQMNYGTMKQDTANVELQQELAHNLYFSAGWFREKLNEVDNYTESNANAITTLYVDTNLKNIDGTPNTHFGNPFLLDISPDTFKTPETNDNYRAMLAYELDFTKQNGWTRWLGHHRFLGLWSEQNDKRGTFRYRYTFDGGDLRYQANPAAPNAIVANSGISRIFYVGADDHGVVQYAPGRIGQPGFGGPSGATVNTYNWTTGQWEQSPLHMSQQLFYAGNYGLTQKVIDGLSLAMQSYFWDDRIVATVGWRRDDYKARQTNTKGTTTTNTGLPTDLYVNGIAIDPSWTYRNLTDWFKLNGTTSTTGVVFKAIRWKGNEIAFHFNRSDNFNPPNGIPVDFYGTPLPKSTGKGKDYGIDFSLFDSKLVARVNWFDATNENATATSAVTAIGRVQGMDTSNFKNWAEYVVRVKAGENTLDPRFGDPAFHPLTSAEKDAVAQLMHIPSYDNWPPPNINGTQTNKAKGIEFQVIYNPIPNWNIKATASKIDSTYQDVAPQIDAWLGDGSTPDTRLYLWQHATSDVPDFVKSDGTPVHLSSFWDAYGYNSNVRLSNATSSNPSWVSSKGYYESAVATEINVAKALQGKAVPNERPWSASLISNYLFTHGRIKGVAVGGALRWADRAIAGFYGDPNKRDSTGLIVAPDLSRPIMTSSETHLDLWISYTRKLKQGMDVKFQLNVRDATESGKLQPIAYNLDGSPFAYRIIDPRQFYFTTTLTF